jgi:hypothetical protein
MTVLHSILLMIASSGAYFLLKGSKKMRGLRVVMIVLFSYASIVILLSFLNYILS